MKGNAQLCRREKAKQDQCPCSPVSSVCARRTVAFQFLLSFARATQNVNQHEANYRQNEAWQQLDYD
jgi:hypothetical protein